MRRYVVAVMLASFTCSSFGADLPRSKVVKQYSKVTHPSDTQCELYWNSKDDLPEARVANAFEIECRKWALRRLEEYQAALDARRTAEQRRQAVTPAGDLTQVREALK